MSNTFSRLQIVDAHKTFNITNNPLDDRLAIDGLSLDIKDGEFVTIIGGNGSGKTTLMNAISGVVGLDKGKILINGNDVTRMPEYKRAKYLGRVFQDPKSGTAANMSILENMFVAYNRNRRRRLKWGFDPKLTDKFKELIGTLNLGLETRMEQKIGLLSGGQRQAITLLMATINTPDILLLDEHTAALDPKTAKKVLELTDKIVKEKNITTLMITHNMKDAIDYGNRLIMINHGKIIYDVSGEEKKNLKPIDLLAKFNDDIPTNIEI